MSKGIFGDWDPFVGLFDAFKQDVTPDPGSQVVKSTTKQLQYTSTLTDLAMVLVVDVPGVDTKSLTVERTGQVLSIEGARGKSHLTQRFTIDMDFDLQTMHVSYKLGQLTFVIARRKLGSDTFQVPIEFK